MYNQIEAFWKKVDKGGNCWVWTASKRSKGYGAFVYLKQGRIVQGRAHRFAWEIHNGDIPIGLCVLHHCDNPSCVKPEHLYLGTKAENNRDMREKGRNVSGSKKTLVTSCHYKRGLEHWNTKVPLEVIQDIKEDRAMGLSYGNLATKYKLSIGYIWRVCQGRARKYG